MPLVFDLINRTALWIGFRDPSVKQIRENAIVRPAADVAAPVA
jgi:hypothetical protein